MAGNDDGFGQSGSDWFETNYRWDQTDRNNNEDRPVVTQNSLTIDPSAGQYVGGTFLSGVALRGSVANFSSVDFAFITGSQLMVEVAKWGGGTLLVDGNFVSIGSTISTQSLAPAGWLSTGGYDLAAGRFVPSPMSHKERLTAERVILELPAGWKLGSFSTARDEIIWYELRRDDAEPPSASTPFFDGGTLTIVINGGSDAVVIGGTSLFPQPAPPPTSPTWVPLNSPLLKVPWNRELRIAGSTGVYKTSPTYASLPTGGPKKLRGIAVEGGGIWLPTDGSAPYFSSGKN